MNTETKIKTILLFGPTGVGKTDLLDRLFAGRGEIISADSMQVYRYMDIGTAKPPEELLRRLPHHLIDLIDPSEQFHTGEFTRRSELLLKEISLRGRIPVLSGGTGFYFRNFLFGMPLTPQCPPEIRAELEKRRDKQGLDSLYTELTGIDPETAGRLAPGDGYRILRALEVFHTGGRPLSDYPPPAEMRQDLDFLILGLNRSRNELYHRIDQRVEMMFSSGLYEEFRSLTDRGYRAGDPGMQGIGYREFFRMMNEPCPSLSRVKEAIKQNSRHYAKRQLTFFRKLPGVQWYHPENDEAKIKKVVGEFI